MDNFNPFKEDSNTDTSTTDTEFEDESEWESQSDTSIEDMESLKDSEPDANMTDLSDDEEMDDFVDSEEEENFTVAHNNTDFVNDVHKAVKEFNEWEPKTEGAQRWKNLITKLEDDYCQSLDDKLFQSGESIDPRVRNPTFYL